MKKELGKLSIRGVIEQLNSLANACQGQPMDERLANHFGWLMSELEKFVDDADKVKRYKKALQEIAFEPCKYPATTASKALECPHRNVETWNHGYHSLCLDCGKKNIY